MDAFKRPVIAVTAFLHLLGALLLTSPPAAYGQDPPTPVNVVNTPNSPVPTTAQGTTLIEGSVSINGTAVVRDAENPAREPFAKLVNATLAAGSVVAFADFSVPAGKRLVMELLGGNASVPVGQKVIFQMLVVTGKAQVGYVFPATPQGTFNTFGGGPFDVFAIGQPLRLYAEPGSTVSVGLARSDTSGQGFLGLAVSGHLVDVP